MGQTTPPEACMIGQLSLFCKSLSRGTILLLSSLVQQVGDSVSLDRLFYACSSPANLDLSSLSALCSTIAHCDAADTGKTSLLEGRKGIVVDDDSTNSTSQEGLAQLIGTSLFDMLEEKQLSTGGHTACAQFVILQLSCHVQQLFDLCYMYSMTWSYACMYACNHKSSLSRFTYTPDAIAVPIR